LTTEFLSRSSGEGGTSKWKRRFLKVYGELSCAVHFQEAKRVIVVSTKNDYIFWSDRALKRFFRPFCAWKF